MCHNKIEVCFIYKFYLDVVTTCNDVSNIVAKGAIATAIRTWKVCFVTSGEIHKHKKVKNLIPVPVDLYL